MPMETTAEYSRFRSMGKQGIEEKERKRKERNIIGDKDKRREEDTRKGNRFPHTNTWLYWEMPIAKANCAGRAESPNSACKSQDISRCL